MALDKIGDLVNANEQRRDLYVLKDFHEFWLKDPTIRRKVRNLAARLRYTGASLIVTSPTPQLPDELRDDAVIIELPLPSAEDLRAELDQLIQSSRVRSDLTVHGRLRLSQAALGLTSSQARRAFSKAIVRDKVLDDRDIQAVLEEKRAVVRQSQALDFYSAEQTPDDVGGLEV